MKECFLCVIRKGNVLVDAITIKEGVYRRRCATCICVYVYARSSDCGVQKQVKIQGLCSSL